MDLIWVWLWKLNMILVMVLHVFSGDRNDNVGYRMMDDGWYVRMFICSCSSCSWHSIMCRFIGKLLGKCFTSFMVINLISFLSLSSSFPKWLLQATTLVLRVRVRCCFANSANPPHIVFWLPPLTKGQLYVQQLHSST